MTELQLNAVRKIREDETNKKLTGREAKFLVPYLQDVLADFCGQSLAFAESVLSKDKDLLGCVHNIKINGRYMSDFEVYRAAVAYFCPDAVIEFKMSIRVPTAQRATILDLNFEDLIKI